MNHEDLAPSKSLTVRQDRVECDPERYSLLLNDKVRVKVINYSPFGVAVESTERLAEKYDDVSFLVDFQEINRIYISHIRTHEWMPGVFRTAFSIQGDPLDCEAARTIERLNDILKSTDDKVESDRKLDSRFRQLILEVKNTLHFLESQVNELALDSFKHDLSYVQHFEDTISVRVSKFLGQAMKEPYHQMRQIMGDLPKESYSAHLDYFRQNVGSIMYQSAYAHRAYSKPRGYAGDYEMMNHVYSRELRGNSLFAKCLQRYFVDEPAGRAVRNREEYMRAKIIATLKKNPGKKIRILSVASGPAMEIQNLVRDNSIDLSNLEIFLLDQDIDALKHAQRKIVEASRYHSKTVNLNLINLGIKTVIQNGLPQKDFDLIYSAGLFDYFTDPVANFAATKLYQGLNPGGSVIIGNFGTSNPNQFAMGLIMDWDLIYRSEDKMKEIFGHIGKTYKLEQEQEGINLFAVIGS